MLAATRDGRRGSRRVTVLAKYQRLEAEAIWWPEPEAQRRDVILSIGQATLTINAPSGTALSHWSLPAILRLNPGKMPALYSPGEHAPERIELADTEMVDAIEAVLKSMQRGSADKARLKALSIGAVLAGILGLATLWLPGAITRYAASLVPEGARTDIGLRLDEHVRKLTGPPCDDPAGMRALANLEARLFPEAGVRLQVLPSALTETAHIPGGTILVGHRLVEDHETPDVLAGYLLAEDLRRKTADPLEAVLGNTGLMTTLRLLTTGKLDDTALRNHAETLVAATPTPVSEATLIDRMQSVGISGSAYGYAIDFSGDTTSPLIAVSQSGPPLMDDGDWLALQRICED